jgi:hypothetical protein
VAGRRKLGDLTPTLPHSLTHNTLPRFAAAAPPDHATRPLVTHLLVPFYRSPSPRLRPTAGPPPSDYTNPPVKSMPPVLLRPGQAGARQWGQCWCPSPPLPPGRLLYATSEEPGHHPSSSAPVSSTSSHLLSWCRTSFAAEHGRRRSLSKLRREPLLTTVSVHWHLFPDQWFHAACFLLRRCEHCATTLFQWDAAAQCKMCGWLCATYQKLFRLYLQRTFIELKNIWCSHSLQRTSYICKSIPLSLDKKIPLQSEGVQSKSYLKRSLTSPL